MPTIHRDLPELAVGYDHVVIDTPPGHEVIVRSALMAVDKAVVPIPPALLDVDRLQPTLDLIMELAPLNDLDFYTRKLGMEVRSDVTVAEMDNFRWLAVGPAGQPDVSIALMAIPGPPIMDTETSEQVRNLMGKGFAGAIFLATDNCRASAEELKGRGVEFVEEPEERPYGIDASFRDPSGNNIRLTEVREV